MVQIFARFYKKNAVFTTSGAKPAFAAPRKELAVGHYILLEYIKQNPEADTSDLPNIYAYFKFKAYLQTTLRCTRKSYCIKKSNPSVNLRYLPLPDLCLLSDSRTAVKTNDSPYDIDWAIKQLEPAQAEIIKLYFYYDKTDMEISNMKRVTRQAVNNTRRRALDRLRELLISNKMCT